MWKKKEGHIVDVYKKNPSAKVPHVRSLVVSEDKVYPGNEFDVFGKDQSLLKMQFAPLYSEEQFSPKNRQTVDDIVLVRSEREQKIEAMHISKRQKVETLQTSPALQTSQPFLDKINHPFIKPTAAENTPIASMFTNPKPEHEEEDLAYF